MNDNADDLGEFDARIRDALGEGVNDAFERLQRRMAQCPTFARTAEIAVAPELATLAERDHVRGCTLCARRLSAALTHPPVADLALFYGGRDVAARPDVIEAHLASGCALCKSTASCGWFADLTALVRVGRGALSRVAETLASVADVILPQLEAEAFTPDDSERSESRAPLSSGDFTFQFFHEEGDVLFVQVLSANLDHVGQVFKLVLVGERDELEATVEFRAYGDVAAGGWEFEEFSRIKDKLGEARVVIAPFDVSGPER